MTQSMHAAVSAARIHAAAFDGMSTTDGTLVGTMGLLVALLLVAPFFSASRR